MEEYNGFTEQERLKGDRIIKKAIENGDLPPLNQTKCCICGQNKGVREYHCEDYSPENILNDAVPLCYACHRRLHKNKYNNPERWEHYKEEVRNGNLCPPHYTDYWTEYDDLNDNQKYVATYEGDKFLSVQAGPGSGKTHTLVEKVKYMVKELGRKPETFLIITFKTDAAEELRDRLIEGDIDTIDVKKMQISTIHSFCLKTLEKDGTVGKDVVEGDKLYLFIKKHKEELGFKNECHISNSFIGTIIQKYNEFSTFEIDTEGLLEYLEGNKDFKVDEKFVNFVHRYMEKNDGKFPEDEVEDNKLYKDSYRNARHIQIVRSYKKYLELLKTENAIDYNQMQFEALRVMNKETYKQEYFDILIDEFQDTDPVQMEIFKKFIESPETNSLTVVGDINQSIYGFRGSKVNYFDEIKKHYSEKFEEVFLPTNYRSTEEIIDFTEDFILPHYEDPEDVPDKSGTDKHNDVYFMVNEDRHIEAENIIEIIKYIIADNRMNLSDIGILSRSVKPNESSCFKTLTKLLDENNIKYQLKGIGDLANNEELRYILTLMYYLIQDENPEPPYSDFVPSDAGEWLNFKTLTGANENNVLFELSDDTKEILNKEQEKFEDAIRKEDEKECEKNKRRTPIGEDFSNIFNKAKKYQKDIFSRVKKPMLLDEKLIECITDEKDLEFFHALNDLKGRINSEEYLDRPTISEIYLELLCDITGYLTVDLVNNQEEVAYNLAAIIPSISVFSEVMYDRGLRGAFWFIKRSIGNLDAYKADEDAVKIMTVHGSKGLEFPVVILASLRKPINRDRGFPSKYDEPNKDSVTYIPTRFYTYSKYDGDPEESHIKEEERILYVAKTRAEDELILSSIVKNSSECVEKALNDYSPENIRAIDKGPQRINDVIDDNLDYTKLINPEDIDINLLDPNHKPPKDETVQLSFTALENYNECPFKYKLADKLGFSFSTKKEIDDGIFIHAALEVINKEIKANDNEYVGDEEVANIVEILFKKANLRFKKEQPEKYANKLETITKDVIRYYKEVGNNLKIISSEYPFYIRGENYAFSGVVDLIYEKDGKLGILDYKNTSLVGEEYLRKYRKQLHFYLMALRDEEKEFDGKNIEEIQIYALKIKDNEKINPLIPFKIDEGYIEELKEELARTADEIKKGEFKPTCEDCGDCQFRKICKK